MGGGREMGEGESDDGEREGEGGADEEYWEEVGDEELMGALEFTEAEGISISGSS